MNLDEAIKVNEDTVWFLMDKGLVEKAKAAQLLIEAGKRVGAYRHFPDRGPGELLPGETEE